MGCRNKPAPDSCSEDLPGFYGLAFSIFKRKAGGDKMGSDAETNQPLVGLTPEETELFNQLDEAETLPIAAFDKHRSQRDPNLAIFVTTGSVPPFRLKAGGWELIQSSIDLGPAMKSRVAERGFFMCRFDEGDASWNELTDLSDW